MAGRPVGLPKTGGRQKGVPNKASIQREAAIAASGLTPLDYMLALLRDETQPQEVRFDAAKAAAGYVHPKLASIEQKGVMDINVAAQKEQRDAAVAAAIRANS